MPRWAAFLRGAAAPLTRVVARAPEPRRSTASAASATAFPRALDFNDTATAFRTRSTISLLRSWLIFRLCTVRPLVTNARRLVDLSNSVFGRTLTSFVLKHTFFAQFCAGEDEDSIRPTLKRLQDAGIGSILDFAAEKDVESAADAHASDADAEEAELDRNLDTTIHALAAARSVGGFAAVKMTALAKPELLQHVSAMLHDHRRAFRRFNVQQVGNPYTDLQVSMPVFLRTLKGPRISDEDASDLFGIIDYGRDGLLDYLEWSDFMALLRLGTGEAHDAAQHAIRGGTPAQLISLLVPAATVELNEDERRRLRNVLRRAHTLAAAARDAGVTILVDAEQTYLQPAIDYITRSMMRRFNRANSDTWLDPEVRHVQDVVAASGVRTAPVDPASRLSTSLAADNKSRGGGAYAAVYNTYQAYLTDTPSRLELDMLRARREDFVFGAKLVRGAYMLQERRLARERGYKDPIHANIDATHACYDACARQMMAVPGAQVMIASHNEQSIRSATDFMAERGVDPRASGVSFGQLLGMCDHISFSLGAAGHRVFKYVPYGPVQGVLPYLIRRAEENSDMLHGGVAKEIDMLERELRRRVSLR